MTFKHKINKNWLVILIIFSFVSCNSDGCTPEKATRKFNNIVTVLDLSGRLEDYDQVNRDQKILKALYGSYQGGLKKVIKRCANCGVPNAKDKIATLIASQENTNNLISKYEPLLSESIGDLDFKVKNTEFETRGDNYIESVEKLYSDAEKYKGKYKGSKLAISLDKVRNYIMPEGEYNNYLFILTDGEKDNFTSSGQIKKLVDDGVSLKGFNVIFLELNPDTNDLAAKNSFVKRVENWVEGTGYKTVSFHTNKEDVSKVITNVVGSQITKTSSGVTATPKPPVDDSLNTGNNEVTIIKEPTQETESKKKGEPEESKITSCSPNVTSLKAKDFKSNNTPVFFYTSKDNLTNEMKALDFITKVNTLRLSGKYNSDFKIKDCVKEAGKITRLEVIGDMKYKN